MPNSGSLFRQQLRALVWRNYMLKRENKGKTFSELLVPLLFVASLASLRSGILQNQPQHVPASPHPRVIGNLPVAYVSDSYLPRIISFAPNTSSDVITIASSVVSYLTQNQGQTKYDYKLYQSSGDIEKAHEADPSSLMVAVILSDDPRNNGSYTIRVPSSPGYFNFPQTNQLYLSSKLYCRGNNGSLLYQCPSLYYYYYGVSNLQAAVDSSLLKLWTNETTARVPSAKVGFVPLEDVTVPSQGWQAAVPLYLILIFSPVISILVTYIVLEKEKKIKEGMLMMGMMLSSYWIAWFISELCVVMFITVATTVMISVFNFFTNSSLVIIFFLIFLFGLSVIMLAFMITPFFSNHKVAGTVSGFIILIFSLFYLLAVFLKGKIAGGLYYLLALLSPAAYALALVKITETEAYDEGITGANLFSGDFSVGASMIMLFIDVLLYGFLAYYFDNVIPGAFGTRQTPLFCFLPSFWYDKEESSLQVPSVMPDITGIANENVEEVPEELKSHDRVQIRGITKTYHKVPQEIVAIDGFSLDIYENQITALIGHNGAGKTTLINMLVGMLKPTKGTATIYGYNIQKASDMYRLRAMTGVCLQEDILFEDLTAKDHLEFFARLKGISSEERSCRISNLIQHLQLQEVEAMKAKLLSGGQKRKLCVGIALIGDPKLLVLDEPSSGLDPYSRQNLWKLLESYKEGRVTILTTHFMDEADILADRKAFISKGKLQCVGSSLFLKKKFGIGYNLTVTVSSGSDDISNLIQSHVPTALLYRVTSSEYCFKLPTEESSHFPKLFNVLEELATDSKSPICSYGISMTTLEDVFLKLVDNELTDVEGLDFGPAELSTENNSNEDDNDSNINFSLADSTHKQSAFQACMAYLKARLLMITRGYKYLIPIVIMPFFCLLISYFMMRNTNTLPSLENQPLALIPSVYPTSSFKLQNLTGRSCQDFIGTLEAQGVIVQMLKHAPKLEDFNSSDHLSAILKSFSPRQGIAEWTWLFNPFYQHSLPILQSLMSNAFWADINSSGTWPSKELRFTFHPFSLTAKDSIAGFQSNVYFFIIFFGMIFVYIPPLISAEVVDDRVNHLKSQLKVSGFGFHLYWGTTLLFHSILFAIIVTVTLGIMMFLEIDFLKSPIVALIVWLLFLLFIPSSLLCCYVVCHIFNKPETTKAYLPLICYLPTMILVIIVMMIDMLSSSETASILHYIFGLISPFYVPQGTLYFVIQTYRKIQGLKAAQVGIEVSTAHLYFEGRFSVLISYGMLLFHIIAYYILLRIVDTLKAGGNIKDTFYSNTTTFDNTSVYIEADPEPEDEDITQEREFVKTCKKDGVVMPLLIDQLYKVYVVGSACRKNRKINIAVRNLSMAVSGGNIFGLLGPNGAGKTSTLRMIIGDEKMASGSISLFGHKVSYNNKEAFKVLGYCPQHNALWNHLTVREHLSLYATLKGVDPKEKEVLCKKIVNGLMIAEHANKRVDALSGGTKRKLAYAISMLGSSEIVLLDEPSVGMDPQSKTFFWKTIIKNFPPNGQKAAVLTTHSMEEAEMLCSKVGIMVTGSLRCLGSIQHLKNKHGQGYTLNVKIAKTNTNLDKVNEFILSFLPSAQQKESIGDKLMYVISSKEIPSLGKIFTCLEKGKSELQIIDEYSFSQVTLEQVFLGVMKEHHFGDVDSSIK